MAFILAKFPPAVSVPLFYVAITIIFILRFLVANLFGIFILSCALYYTAPSFLGVDPYSFSGLVVWFSDQEDSTKTSLLASIVTVMGFLIAFASASYNWRSQALSQLRIEAAAEIDRFFAQCTQRATDCRLYAEGLVEAVNEIQRGCDRDEAAFLARYHREKGLEFERHRQELVALGVEAHRLQGRYTNLLTLSPGLIANMQIAISALSRIIDEVWFNRPFIIDHDPDPVSSFIHQTNVAECLNFSKVVEDHFIDLNFSSGLVRGNLQSSVVGFSFWSLVFLYSEMSGFRAAITEHYESRRRKLTSKGSGR